MIILTGGAGFIGSVMLARLNASGVDDVVVVDDLGHADKWCNLSNKRFADYLHKDELMPLLDRGALTLPKAIVHMGACSSTKQRDVEYLLRNNYRYTKTLCEYALTHGARFIYASSAATYGDGQLGFDDCESLIPNLRPLNPYGYSKQLFDQWVLRSGISSKICGLKFFNVFGPNENHKKGMWSVIYNAYQQIQDTGTVKLFKSYDPNYPDGGQRRDFVYVRECVEVIWQLLEKPAVNGIFNLGSGHATTWRAMVESVFAALNLPPQIEYIPMPDGLRKQYQYVTLAKMERLNRALGRSSAPEGVSEGVREYVQDFLQTGGVL